jgi:hypothetical protein
MGLGAIRLAEMEDYVRVVMALLRGETVEAAIEDKTRLIRLLNPELGLIDGLKSVALFSEVTNHDCRLAHWRLHQHCVRQYHTVISLGGDTSLRAAAAWREPAGGSAAASLGAVGFSVPGPAGPAATG